MAATVDTAPHSRENLDFDGGTVCVVVFVVNEYYCEGASCCFLLPVCLLVQSLQAASDWSTLYLVKGKEVVQDEATTSPTEACHYCCSGC